MSEQKQNKRKHFERLTETLKRQVLRDSEPSVFWSEQKKFGRSALRKLIPPKQGGTK